mgnify:CR=1 FL=1
MSASTTTKEMAFNTNSKGVSVRESNILAARAVADIVRTSLGPRGMDKMMTGPDGQHIITNDGATILAKIETSHPAAKMVRSSLYPLRKRLAILCSSNLLDFCSTASL